jgi:hypothetical protein
MLEPIAISKRPSQLSEQRVGAVLVGTGPLYSRRTEQLAALAARHALPTIYPYREYAPAGRLATIHGYPTLRP